MQKEDILRDRPSPSFKEVDMPEVKNLFEEILAFLLFALIALICLIMNEPTPTSTDYICVGSVFLLVYIAWMRSRQKRSH